MISKTSEYALRAVIHLAQAQPQRPVRAGELAQALDVPANYLSKILHQLARVDILVSERGPRGGFRLARDASRLPLADVVEPFDKILNRSSCLLGRPECSDGAPCAAHDGWKRALGAATQFFRETMVSDLFESVEPA